MSKEEVGVSHRQIPSREVMDELMMQKLETVEGAAKLAEYGGIYLQDRVKELQAAGVLSEEDAYQFLKCSRVLSGCSNLLKVQVTL